MKTVNPSKSLTRSVTFVGIVCVLLVHVALALKTGWSDLHDCF